MNYDDKKKAANLALIGSIREEILPSHDLVHMLLTYLKENYPDGLKTFCGNLLPRIGFCNITFCPASSGNPTGNRTFSEGAFSVDFIPGIIAVPAVCAEIFRRNTDGGNHIVQTVVPQAGEL